MLGPSQNETPFTFHPFSGEMRRSDARAELADWTVCVHPAKLRLADDIVEYWSNPALGEPGHRVRDCELLQDLEKFAAIHFPSGMKEWTQGKRPIKFSIRDGQVLMYIGTTSKYFEILSIISKYRN